MPSSGNHHDIDGEASTLLAIQVTRNGKVLDDAVLLIKRIEESPAFEGVVQVGAPVLRLSQLAAHDEYRAAIFFHRLERLEGNRLINLRCASSITWQGESTTLPLFISHGTKGGIGDDDIMLLVGLILAGIELSDGVALSPQISRAIWIEFIDGDLSRIRSQQQCAMSGSRFIDSGIGINSRQSRS